MNNNRQLYIDNIRLLMIILVVLMHIAVTYSGMGGWYYVETDPDRLDIIQLIFFGFNQAFWQAFFMGILFLIAGYFTPTSYDKKGFTKFIKDRFFRLGLPTIIYMLVIHPLLVFVILGYRADIGSSLVMAYADYIKGLHFLGGSGPLWFAFALLIFSIIYALLRLLFPKLKETDKSFPTTQKIIGLILLISICAFLIRIIQPIGTDILNMQLGYFSSYIVLYIVGIMCKRNNWFEKLDYSTGKVWLVCAISIGFVMFAVIMILGGALEGDIESINGRGTWQSAAFALWESFVAVSISIGLLAFFKKKYNRQNKIVKRLSRNAFSVYVFHSLIIVSLSLLFKSVNVIPIVKFLTLAIIGIPICFLCTDLTIQRIPFLRKLFA